MEIADEINNNRLATWNIYRDAFKALANKGIIELPTIPEGCVHNAHMFYFKCRDLETRQKYIQFMKENDILCVFHYVPLHSAPAGLKFGRFHGEDEFTTKESERLVRLPMYYKLTLEQVDFISSKVKIVITPTANVIKKYFNLPIGLLNVKKSIIFSFILYLCVSIPATLFYYAFKLHRCQVY